MAEDKEKPEAQVDPAATNNLVGFFAQLLEIDKRVHPEDYTRAQYNDHA